jgi:DNA-binding NtrC family response regulator
VEKISEYKTIYVIDPVKGERLHLAKFLMQDAFTIMSFSTINDCFKKNHALFCDLVIVSIRKGKFEDGALEKIRDKYKKTMFILYNTPDSPEINIEKLHEAGFKSVFKANSKEGIKEIAYGHLAPDGLKTRPETPHPVPLPSSI